MTDKRFPTYRDHREVSCFQCGQQLDLREAHVSGYATGFWAQHCRACDVTTFYDLAGEPAPQEDTRPDQRGADHYFTLATLWAATLPVSDPRRSSSVVTRPNSAESRRFLDAFAEAQS
jgi:hypothetical protein